MTVHLTRPDGDFLHKLTTPFAYVVPADTPVRLIGARPPPGTGPYRVARWHAQARRGCFVRNPHFGLSPQLARPASRTASRSRSRRRGRHRTRRSPTVRARRRRSGRARQPVRQLRSAASACGRSRPAPRVAAQQPGAAPSGCSSMSRRRAVRRPSRPARRSTSRPTARGSSSSRAARRSPSPTCQFVPARVPGLRALLPVHARRRPAAVDGAGHGAGPPARRSVRAGGRACRRRVPDVPARRRALLRRAARRPRVPRLAARAHASSEYFGSIYDAARGRRSGSSAGRGDYVSAANFIAPHFSCATPAARSRSTRRGSATARSTRQVAAALAAPPAERRGALGGRRPPRGRSRAGRAADEPPRASSTSPSASATSRAIRPWFTLLDQLWVR